MKYAIIAMIVSIGFALRSIHTPEISNERAIKAMQQMQQLQALMEQPDGPSEADQQAIYQAYPNNPELYRWLQNNPRYIPRYLGK